MIDEKLEAAIKEAGESRVMAMARSLGWINGAPKWVWWEIVHKLKGK